MSRRQRTWVYNPPKPAKPKVPELVKAGIQQRAEQLIAEKLKPAHIQPPPEEPRFNYITNLYTKWYRSYFYFCAEYASPGENALSPTFESKFARMEWVGPDRFNIAFQRHTGEWIELASGISEKECYEMIAGGEGFFLP